MATSQVALRRERNGPDLQFNEAFRYGPSTKNIRIESWWNLLLKGQTRGWRKYFQSLTEEGLFVGSQVDKISLRYLYMKSIRRHIQGFVDMHNVHDIRRQKSRAHYLPHGKPDEMFFYPPEGSRNYISPVDGPLIEHLEKQVEAYDPDLYLHPDTELLCEEFAQKRFPGFDISHLALRPGLEQQHVEVYRFLRESLYSYQEAGNTILDVELPRGAQAWIKAIAKVQSENLTRIENERAAEEEGQENSDVMLSEVEIDDGEDDMSDGGNDGENGDDDLIYDPLQVEEDEE